MAPVQDPDPRPLPGEPLALDLLNTQWLASGSPVDLLATPEGTRTWLAAAGVAAATAHRTREALVTARQAIRDVLTGQGGTAARDRLDEVLGHGCLRLSLGPGATATQTLEVDDPAWQPAVMAAVNLLDLLGQAPDRIRQCQHPPACCGSTTPPVTGPAAGASWPSAATAPRHTATTTASRRHANLVGPLPRQRLPGRSCPVGLVLSRSAGADRRLRRH